MALSDAKVRSAKPKDKQYKLTDGEGMYLLVTTAGGKCWRLKYRFEGKEKTLALGTYPVVSLLDAREKRLSAKKLLSNGIDPGQEKRIQRVTAATSAGNTFESVANSWHTDFTDTWEAEHVRRLRARLDNYLMPYLGPRPIADIEAPEILACLKRAQKTSNEIAMRVRVMAGQIWRYAVSHGYAKYNPVPDLRGAIPPPAESHYSAPTDPKKLGPLLKMIEGYEGSFITKCALRLAPLAFVRPGELRAGEWSEVDFGEAQWNIPGNRMKEGEPHIVPLCRQALGILRDLHDMTGRGRYMFPSLRSADRCMSENTVNAALRRLGIGKDELTGHGFRATARTIMDEILHYRPDIIEHQLAHRVIDPNGRAYNRTAHLDYRRGMMQGWADYLDGLKATAFQSALDKAPGS